MKNILVLGSEGIIGKGLCKVLEKKGHCVTHWDISNGSHQDLRNCNGVPDTSLYDFVYFLAYDIGGAKYLAEQGIEFISNNLLIMHNVFEELKKSRVSFIFASSQMQNMPVPYGTLKKLGEHYTEALGGLSIRFCNVYGTEDHSIKSHVITDFIKMYKETGIIRLLTDGSEKRQFLHTEDCGEALSICMDNYESFKEKKYIDVTNFESINIKELATIVIKTIGNVDNTDNTDNFIVPGTKTDSLHLFQNEPYKFILSYWRPVITLEEGIRGIADTL